MHELLEEAGRRGMDLEPFFNKHLRGRIAIISYSRRFIKMESIHLDEDERVRFKKRDGEKISYGRWVKERYGMAVPLRERYGIIKDKGRAAFLPQFLNIGATNEMIGNDGNDFIRDYKENIQPQQRMDLIQKFVQTANNRLYSLKKAFETSERPLNCKADCLPRPQLEIVDKKGQPLSGEPNQFSKVYPNIGGFNNVHKQWKVTPMRIGILCHRNDRHSYNEVCNNLKAFLGRRYGIFELDRMN